MDTDTLLRVSSSPHLHSPVTTPRLMRDVLIALLPALIASVVLFGPRALLLTAVCVAACVLAEYLSHWRSQRGGHRLTARL